ncbi:MAG: serine/threonine-protein kinase [Planctomycetota bacterium]
MSSDSLLWAEMVPILAEVTERRGRGETVDLDEYVRRHPHLADELRDLFHLLDLLGDPGGDRARPAGAGAFPGLPEQLGDFRLLRPIALGGMGFVLEAEQISLGRTVAMKVILPQFADDPGWKRRFRREARAAAKLDHPGIVRVYASGEEAGLSYLAMELVPDGRTLVRWVAEQRQDAGSAQGPVRFREAARLIAEVAEALQQAHDHDLIHRDVKPSNILLDPAGHPRLSDFGLVRNVGSDTVTGQVSSPGTPRYMSPEQLSGKRDGIDFRTDIYSLGVTLYEMVTLSAPYRSRSASGLLREIRAGAVLPPSDICCDVPRDLEAVICKALEKDVSRRYSSASAFAEDLMRFLRGEPVRTRPAGAARRLRLWLRCKATGLIVAGSVLLLLVAAIWIGGTALTLDRGNTAFARDNVVFAEILALRKLLDQTFDPQKLSGAADDARTLLDEATGLGKEKIRLALHALLADLAGKMGRREEESTELLEIFKCAPDRKTRLEAYARLVRHPFEEMRIDQVEKALRWVGSQGAEELPPDILVMKVELLLAEVTSPRPELDQDGARDALRSEALDLLETLRGNQSVDEALRTRVELLMYLLEKLQVRSLQLEGLDENARQVRKVVPLPATGDGPEDLVLLMNDRLVRLTWSKTEPSRLIQDPVSTLLLNENCNQLVAGHFDADSLLDLATMVTVQEESGLERTKVLFLRQTGLHGRFEEWCRGDEVVGAGMLAALDMDGDGRDELAVCDVDRERNSHVLTYVPERDRFIAIPFPPEDVEWRDGQRLDTDSPCASPLGNGHSGLLVNFRSYGCLYPRLGLYRLVGGSLVPVDNQWDAPARDVPLIGDRLSMATFSDPEHRPWVALACASTVAPDTMREFSMEEAPSGIYILPSEERTWRSWVEAVNQADPRLRYSLPAARFDSLRVGDLDPGDGKEIVFLLSRPASWVPQRDARQSWVGIIWNFRPPKPGASAGGSLVRIAGHDEFGALDIVRGPGGRQILILAGLGEARGGLKTVWQIGVRE